MSVAEQAGTGSEGASDGERTRLVRATLERGLSRHVGARVHIAELRSTFQRRSTSYRTERLHLKLGDRTHLRAFFKDLSPSSLLPLAREIRMPMLGSGRVEWRMYRDVLSPERDGTPRLYASRWQPGRSICWLFLEDIGSRDLLLATDLGLWPEAARWAARFHARTLRLPIAALRFLPRLDAAHFLSWGVEVARRCSALPPEERAIVSRALDVYRTVAPRLAGLPVSVIHGQLFGSNVLLRRGPAAEAIAVVDWETTALGPSYLDVVSLNTGRWTPSQKLAMRRAYFEQYRTATGKRLRWQTFCRDLEDLELYQALRYLTPTLRTTSLRPIGTKRRRWIGELRRILRAGGRLDG